MPIDPDDLFKVPELDDQHDEHDHDGDGIPDDAPEQEGEDQ